jgi:hypothetical protein
MSRREDKERVPGMTRKGGECIGELTHFHGGEFILTEKEDGCLAEGRSPAVEEEVVFGADEGKLAVDGFGLDTTGGGVAGEGVAVEKAGSVVADEGVIFDELQGG